VGLAADAGVKKLILFHHDPIHNDAMIDKMATIARSVAKNRGNGKTLVVEPAKEGMEIILNGIHATAGSRSKAR
jgi:hypothetical protein